MIDGAKDNIREDVAKVPRGKRGQQKGQKCIRVNVMLTRRHLEALARLSPNRSSTIRKLIERMASTSGNLSDEQ